MAAKNRFFFFLVLFAGFSLQAFAFTPKVKHDINDGTGCTNPNITDGNEVKLPIGLPFSTDGSATGSADDADISRIVYTFDLPDGQGPETFHETHSAFEQARSLNAACVLIRMNSMAGALDAASNLRNEISDYDRPVMVYVNDKAFPASTLISMAKVKHTSAIETHQKSHASVIKTKCPRNETAKDLSPYLPDENSCLNGLGISSGKNLNAGQDGNLDAVLTEAGLKNYTVVHYSPGFFAQVIDWCMKPFASLLLVILIALGLRIQVRSAFPGPATFLLMVVLPLFAIPLFVGGLAGAGESGLVLFSAIALLFLARKNSSNLLQLLAALVCIGSLTLCQSQSAGQTGNWQAPAITLLLTGVAFFAGWFLPVVALRFRRTSSVKMEMATA
jgi:membrane-bound ClpP family serine protease